MRRYHLPLLTWRHPRCQAPYTVSHHTVGEWFSAPMVAHGLAGDVLQRSGATRYDPHLSCWERQAEGIDQGSERGEASLNAVGLRERHQREPGQEHTGAHAALQPT